jgi:hypothetical protein
MGVKAVVSLPDEFAVEAFLAPARFISGHKQDRPALRVEGEGKPPFAVCRTEAQLLRIRVARTVEYVNTRPS